MFRVAGAAAVGFVLVLSAAGCASSGSPAGPSTVAPLSPSTSSSSPAFPADELALLETGKSYILFLQPFTFSDRLEIGQFAVAGEVGSFVVDGARAKRATRRGSLPRDLPLETLTATVSPPPTSAG